MDVKHCPDCTLDKPTSAFTRDVRQRDGLAFYCRDCANVRQTASRRRRDGPPRSRNGQGPRGLASGLKWCPECNDVKPTAEFPRARSQRNGVGAYRKPCSNQVINENREKNHGSGRNYRYTLRYGITEAVVDAMLEEQQGVCAICREAVAVHLDHDHKTGRVRGLLCFHCNQALGNFRDRGDLMQLAVHYLERGARATYTRPPGVSVTFAMGFDGEDPRPPDEEQDIPPSMIA